MIKVSIFRVETPDGGGPYGAGNPYYDHMNAVHGDADHPSPEDDALLDGIYPDEYCGFATLTDLEEWFSGYEDVLADAGFEISVYTVPLSSVRYGLKQAVFLRSDNYPVRSFPMR
jgi:hypothetical protein